MVEEDAAPDRVAPAEEVAPPLAPWLLIAPAPLAALGEPAAPPPMVEPGVLPAAPLTVELDEPLWLGMAPALEPAAEPEDPG